MLLGFSLDGLEVRFVQIRCTYLWYSPAFPPYSHEVGCMSVERAEGFL